MQRRRRRSRYLKVHPYTVWNGKPSRLLARPLSLFSWCGAALRLSPTALPLSFYYSVECAAAAAAAKLQHSTRRARLPLACLGSLAGPSAFIYIIHTGQKTHRVPPMLPYLGLSSKSLSARSRRRRRFFAHSPSSSCNMLRAEFMHRARFFGFAFWPPRLSVRCAVLAGSIGSTDCEFAYMCPQCLFLSVTLLARLFCLSFLFAGARQHVARISRISRLCAPISRHLSLGFGWNPMCTM